MFDFLHENIKLKIAASLILGLAITLFLQWVSRRGIEDLLSTNARVIENFQAAKLLEGFKAAVLSFESITRGYYITRDSVYVENFNASVVTAQTYLVNLEQELDQHEFRPDLESLHHLLEAKIRFNQSVIETSRAQLPEAAYAFDDNRGKVLMDSIEQVADNLLTIEEQLIQQDIAENDRLARRVMIVQTVGSFVAGIIAAVAIFFLFRDLEKRARLERSLQTAKEQAEQSKLLEEQFMANMSHEIRTPLNAIMGFTGLLNRTRLSDRQREYVHTIEQSSENLLSIVNDILDFAKIEEGMLKLERIPFSPHDVCRSVERMFLPRAEEKGIRLIASVAPGVPTLLLGDPVRLTQILANLAGNAMKFTPKGSVELALRRLRGDGGRVLLELSVSDTGVGIPVEKIDDVFKRFYQGDADTTRRYGGTGLGLSIVARLVALHNGVVRVESKPDEGTRFTIEIPYELPEAGQFIAGDFHRLPAIEETLSAPVRFSVLAAEDNPVNRRLLELLLARWNVDFAIVGNGRELLAEFERRPADLVLMDIQMPEMDGYTAAVLLRRQYGEELPIVAMTAHALPGERDKCLAYGMSDYLSKPISERDLHAVIARWARRPAESAPVTATEENPASAGRLFDFNYLAELSKGKTAFIREMIDLFLDRVPREIAMTEQALADADFETARRMAHSLQSTASSMGLTEEVLDCLRDLESAAAQSDLPSAQASFDHVRSFLSAAVAEVEKELASRF